MFDYILGKIQNMWNKKFIINDYFGLEIIYEWTNIEWEFWIYNYFDQNNHNYIHYVFDSIEKKEFFEKIYKIQWIWPKVSYQISLLDVDKMKSSVESFDIKFFTAIPWIWEKTAKRILVELKNNFDKDDMEKINENQEIYKNIISTLKPLWYDSKKIKTILKKCTIKMNKKNIKEIIKWTINNI